MGFLRIYRKFYCGNIRNDSSGRTETYTLTTPDSLVVNSFIAGTGGTESTTQIESNITFVEEETGIIYADLNPTLYSTDNTYDLVWSVNYIPEAPLRKISTRFRIKPVNIANQLDFEINSNNQIEYEINSTPIEYEIVGPYN